jgi:hypothetical protein
MAPIARHSSVAPAHEVPFRAQQLPRARSVPQAARRLGHARPSRRSAHAQPVMSGVPEHACRRSPEVPSDAGRWRIPRAARRSRCVFAVRHPRARQYGTSGRCPMSMCPRAFGDTQSPSRRALNPPHWLPRRGTQDVWGGQAVNDLTRSPSSRHHSAFDDFGARLRRSAFAPELEGRTNTREEPRTTSLGPSVGSGSRRCRNTRRAASLPLKATTRGLNAATFTRKPARRSRCSLARNPTKQRGS